jgi:toxin ParE1/3/4
MNRPKLDLRIRRSAKADLAEIVDYLAERNLSAATRFVESAHHEFEFIRQYPGAGAIREAVPPSLSGLRSWPIKGFRKYLIFYLRAEQVVEIIRVLHGNRDVNRIISRS